MRCSFWNNLLRELASPRFSNRLGNIARTWNPHSLINIRTARKRITNGSSDTSRSPTKRLNFCWMVVGFIFKHQQPRLFDAIHIHFNLYWAGIDLIRHFHVIQTAISSLIAPKNSRHIHKGLRFVTTSQLIAHSQVFIISSLELLFKLRSRKINLLQLRLKGRMSTVVGPVSI